MNKKLKIGLIVGGSLVVAGLGVYFGRQAIVKRRERKQDEKRIQEQKDQLAQLQAGLESQSSSTIQDIDCSRPQRKVPNRNVDMDIINPLSEIKGKKLYPATKSDNPEKGHKYALGYTNVRNSAEVNTRTGTFDYSNLIYKHSSTSPIGTIVSEQYDNQDPKHRWFKVKLTNKKEDCSGWTGGLFGCDTVSYGWVRADTVTFKGTDTDSYSDECQTKFHCQGQRDKVGIFKRMALDIMKSEQRKKYDKLCQGLGVDSKSRFEGMTEVYDTSYQLGASVFPHSNWEEEYFGIDGNRFELDDTITDL